jgi:hypothetical protein
LVALGLNVKFSQAEIASGYWRIPFLIGGVFGFIAMFLRQWLVRNTRVRGDANAFGRLS